MTMVMKIQRWQCSAAYTERESSRTGRGGLVGSWRNLVRSWHKRILRNGQYYYKQHGGGIFRKGKSVCAPRKQKDKLRSENHWINGVFHRSSKTASYLHESARNFFFFFFGRTTARQQDLENTKKRSYSNLKKGTVKEVMKGTVTKMVDKTIKVVTAGSAKAFRRGKCWLYCTARLAGT